MAEVTDLLKRVAIFKDLDEDELNQVADVCKEEKFVSGEYIFREGEHGNRLYLIVDGEVRISRDVPGSGEEALAVLKAGALFGEMAVFDRTERSTHAISNGGTTRAHHQPPRLRDAARLQSRDRVQGAVGVRSPALVAPPVDERFAAIVPGDVDVLTRDRLSASSALGQRRIAHLTAEFTGVPAEQLRDATLLGGLLIAAASAGGFSPIGVPDGAAARYERRRLRRASARRRAPHASMRFPSGRLCCSTSSRRRRTTFAKWWMSSPAGSRRVTSRATPAPADEKSSRAGAPRADSRHSDLEHRAGGAHRAEPPGAARRFRPSRDSARCCCSRRCCSRSPRRRSSPAAPSPPWTGSGRRCSCCSRCRRCTRSRVGS